MAKIIDFNCDLGEGFGIESEIMPLISSCNIACGGHAGDEETMSYTVQLACEHQVKIGAHPSFPDKKNFGRKVQNLSSEQLFETIHTQIEGLNSILNQRKLALNHVKPHGALYNCAAVDERIAHVVVEVVKSFGNHIELYAPFQSVVSNMAVRRGVSVKYEAFADRNYNPDLTLVSRNEPNALIKDVDDMFNHVHGMIMLGKITAINGVGKTIKVDTICVHGDGVNVVRNLKILVDRLGQHNIIIR